VLSTVVDECVATGGKVDGASGGIDDVGAEIAGADGAVGSASETAIVDVLVAEPVVGAVAGSEPQAPVARATAQNNTMDTANWRHMFIHLHSQDSLGHWRKQEADVPNGRARRSAVWGGLVICHLPLAVRWFVR
jgi:hypothetical protein